MSTINFLRRSLGDAGFYCLFAANRATSRKVQTFYTDIESMVDVAEQLDSKFYDTYFALGTFTGEENEKGNKMRTVECVSQMRSLFLDLDVGDNDPKKFASKSDAISALRNFCRRLGMPRPTMVDSGGGVHVYWNLDKPVSIDEWLPVATKLKQLCKQHGFLADPTVTADAARILRIPLTHNYKTEPPNQVTMLGVDSPDGTSLEAMAEILGANIAPTSSFTVDREEMSEAMGASAVSGILMQNITSRFSTIAKKSLTDNGGCAQIKHAILHPTEIDEPQWRAALSIAAHCVDEGSAIHKISRGHPDYDFDDTAEKANRIKGPYLCERFDDFNPDVCPSCPLWKKIKSPISIGKETKATEFDAPTEEGGLEEIVISAPAPNHPTAPLQNYVIPKPPAPYVRGAAGGIYKIVINDDGDKEEEFVYHHDLYATRRIYDIDDGDSVVVRLHLPRDGVREFTLPQWQVASGQDLRKKLAAQGITAKHINAWNKIGDYLVDWINELQSKAAADKAHRQFGWTEDMKSFLLGDREYMSGGVGYNPPTPATATLMPAFSMKGTVADWCTSMDIYNQEGMELYQLVMAMGFGSPIMAMSAVNGFVLHLDGATGYGKTTVQLAAMSIWGNPEELKMDDQDTANSKLNRLEVCKNVFGMFDEMTNTEPRALSMLAYAVSGGRQKNRMSSGSNQERTRGAPWACLVVSSGNMSWHARIESIKSDAAAEKERVFEVRLRDYVKAGSKSDTDTFAKNIKEKHYGVAGDVYMRYLTANMDQVSALYDQVQAKLDAAAGLQAPNRFRSAGFAASLTGIIIAKQLGLVNYDPANLFKYVVRLLTDAAEDTANTAKSWDDVINEYIAEKWNNILRIKSTQDLRGNADPDVDELVIPDSVPHGSFVARYETDVGRLFLLPKPLKAWCARGQLNYGALVEGLGKNYEVKSVTMRIGKGTKIKLPPTKMLLVNMNLDKAEIVEDVDEFDNEEGDV